MQKSLFSAILRLWADGAGKATRTIPYTVEIEWDGQADIW